jgi:hypothetical protein
VKPTRGRIITPEAKAREDREAVRTERHKAEDRARAARARKIARSWIGNVDRSVAVVDAERVRK